VCPRGGIFVCALERFDGVDEALHLVLESERESGGPLRADFVVLALAHSVTNALLCTLLVFFICQPCQSAVLSSAEEVFEQSLIWTQCLCKA
jgi:hypothetical protein